eukprot:81522_1
MAEETGGYYVDIRCVSEEPTVFPTQSPTKYPTKKPSNAPVNHPITAHSSVPPAALPTLRAELSTKRPTPLVTVHSAEVTDTADSNDHGEDGDQDNQLQVAIYVVSTFILCYVCLCGGLLFHKRCFDDMKKPIDMIQSNDESAINNDIQHEDLQSESDPVTKQGPPAGVIATATSGEMGGRLPIYNAQLVMKGSVKVTRGNVAMQKVVKHENEGEMGHTQQTPKDDIIDFDRDLVVQWMRNKVKLPQYTENFLNQGYVMMSAIQAINSREELAVCGVQKEGHQTLILAEIALYKVQNVTPGVNNKSNEDNAVGGQLPPPPMTGDTNGGNEGWLDIT